MLRRPATLELATFSTMSKTGRRAVGTLLQHYNRLQTSNPGAYPVVRLKPSGYQDNRFGWVQHAELHPGRHCCRHVGRRARHVAEERS